MVEAYINDQKFNQGVQSQQDKVRGNEALNNIRSFYKDNKNVCEKAYEYYFEFQENKEKYLSAPVKKTRKEFFKLLPSTTILVLTVTQIENAVFLHWLYEQNKGPLCSYLVDDTVLTVCSIDSDRMIVHVNALRTGEESTRVALNQVRKIFIPDYLFMLGICYGLNMDKYSIGAVFISNSVSTFRLNFREDEKSDETIFEAEDEYDCSPSNELIRKIEHFFACIEVHSVVSDTMNPTTAESEIGRFLSSNSLVSSRRVKQAVLEQYSNKKPNPLGGEMEAAGILKSNLVEEDGFNNWMIIKSICDWGEKKNQLSSNKIINEKVKDSLQAFAMTNTCGAFESALRAL